jgi:Uma2 family endonuclease
MVVDRTNLPMMTLDEYRALERASTGAKHEYFDGQVYAMAGGTRRHSRLGRNIVGALTAVVGEGPCEVYISDMRVRLSDSVEVYPDATVTCDERDITDDEDDEIVYPKLVVEVLSPGTEHIDRGRKLHDYQRCPSVEEYALVNADYRAVEVYRRNGPDWTYHRYEGDDVVGLACIDARIPLAAIYHRTAIPAVPPR